MTENKTKAKRAFTLVELIVVIALISILGTAIISILVPTSNLFGKMSSTTEAKMKTDQIMETLVKQVRFSEQLEVAESLDKITQNWSDGTKLYCKDGRVMISKAGAEKDLFSEDFYNGFDADIWAKKIENNLIEIKCTVTLHNDSSISNSLDTSVEVYNADTIAGTEGHVLFYVWQNQ